MIGQRLGRYDVLELVGSGGMGSVYRALDTQLDRVVALKVMSAALVTNAEAIARFKREAQSLARLQHPSIVTVFDYFEHGGHLCLVMELVPGEPLDRVIDHKWSIPIEKKLRLMAAVCRALEYAHGKNVVHRDLKPGNVLMLSDYSPKIVDFGIAKLMDDGKISRTSSNIGTVAYMAPEQFSGKMDHRTDIYATGILLYEFLSGISPFGHSDTAVCMKKILMDPTPELPKTLFGVPGSVHEIVAKAMQKEPSQRYQRAAEMAAVLEQALMQGPPPPPPKFASPPPPPKPAPPPPPKPAPKPSPTVIETPVAAHMAGKPPIPVAAKKDQAIGHGASDKDAAKQKRLAGLGVLLGIAMVVIITAIAIANSSSSSGTGSSATKYGHGLSARSGSHEQLADEAVGQELYSTAAEEYTESCRVDNVPSSCNALGWLYSSGKASSLSAKAVEQLFFDACYYNDMAGCTNLGVLRYDRDDAVGADTYWHKACEDGLTTACNYLFRVSRPHHSLKGSYEPPANFHAFITPVKALAPIAEFDFMCGNPQDCALRGYGYDKSKAITKAVTYYRKSCDDDSSLGCYILGTKFILGQGVPADASVATSLFQISCDGGEKYACDSLGDNYNIGRGVHPDHARAIDFWKKACELGLAKTCTYLQTEGILIRDPT